MCLHNSNEFETSSEKAACNILPCLGHGLLQAKPPAFPSY